MKLKYEDQIIISSLSSYLQQPSLFSAYIPSIPQGVTKDDVKTAFKGEWGG